MDLVVGATGMLGLEICRRLRDAGRPLRALVRKSADAGRRAELQSLGAELVEGDLKAPASLRRACQGVQAVVSTASSTFSRQEGDSIRTVDEGGQIALVDAAKSTAVEHFVFVSFPDDPGVQYPLTRAKRAVEAHLKASGMAYTILQASYFMEVWLAPALGFDFENGKARIYGEGTGRINWVSYHDVARLAVGALEQPGARNKVLPAGGPEALSLLEVVKIFEASGAAEFREEHLPEAELASQMKAAGDALQESFAGLMLQCARGGEMDMTETLGLLPLSLTSVRAYASRQLAG